MGPQIEDLARTNGEVRREMVGRAALFLRGAGMQQGCGGGVDKATLSSIVLKSDRGGLGV